jgi:hypothetical protein
MNRFQGWMVAGVSLLALNSCGGGGGGSVVSGSGAVLHGVALDAPIPDAQVTLTALAPLGDPGAQTLGTATADGNGNYSISALNLPAGSVPIFASASDPSLPALVLTSYLGPASSLAALTGTVGSTQLLDLDISPVTTAALAVYAQTNAAAGYGGLTPTLYGQTLLGYGGDVLAIASAIKAVGENLCSPAATVTSTTNLAALIASQSNLTSANATSLTTAGTVLGGTCPNVLAALAQQISADPTFGPELQLGDVIDANVNAVVAPGNYTLQGLVAELGVGQSSLNPVVPLAPMVFTDATVSVNAAGLVTSNDNQVSGTLNGNFLTLTVTPAVGVSYTLQGKVGVLPSAILSPAATTGYGVRAQGVAADTSLVQFEAVLTPTGAMPLWTGWSASTQSEGMSCTRNSYLLNLDTLGSLVGGAKLGECVLPNATGWSMTAASGPSGYFDGYEGNSGVAAPTLVAPVWTGLTAAPFVLSSGLLGAAFTGPTGSVMGTAYYVLGGDAIVFASGTGSLQHNSMIRIKDSHLPQWSEVAATGSASGDGGVSQMGDH